MYSKRTVKGFPFYGITLTYADSEFGPASQLSRIQKCAESAYFSQCDAIGRKRFSLSAHSCLSIGYQSVRAYFKLAQYCCHYTVVGKTALTLTLMNWGRLYHYKAHLCTAYLPTRSDLVLLFVNYLILFFSSAIFAWELT